MEKYMTIAEDIKRKITTNELSAGQKLPSLKESAKYYQCAEETMAKAYRELIKQHLIYAKKKSGHFVAQTKKITNDEESINLSTGNVQIDIFPIIDAQANLIHAIHAYGNKNLNYKLNINGTDSLIEALIEHKEKHQIFSNPKNVFITQGVLQSFSMLCSCDFLKGEYVLVENPTYSYALKTLKTQNIKTIGINRTKTGINLAELEEIFKTKSIRFFYIVPYNHNPLGTNLPYDNLLGIVRLAKKYNIFIVEDDYFLEGPNHKRKSTLFEHLRDQCFYLSSYTKLLPFLRIGYIIIPNHLIEEWKKLIQIKNYLEYFYPPLISQATLETMLRNGSFYKFREGFNEKITNKRNRLRNVTQEWDTNIIELIDGNAGMYALILLNPLISVSRFYKNLEQSGILVKLSKESFIDTNHPYYHSVRVSISMIELEDIKPVFDQIFATAKEIFLERQLYD